LEINPLKYLTLSRTVNIVKVLSSFTVSKLVRKPVVWGMPISYSIEPTNYCNLKCPECPSGLGTLTRPLGLLKLDDFKRLIDEIKDTPVINFREEAKDSVLKAGPSRLKILFILMFLSLIISSAYYYFRTDINNYVKIIKQNIQNP